MHMQWGEEKGSMVWKSEDPHIPVEEHPLAEGITTGICIGYYMRSM